MLNKNKFILFASTIGKQIEFTSFDSRKGQVWYIFYKNKIK